MLPVREKTVREREREREKRERERERERERRMCAYQSVKVDTLGTLLAELCKRHAPGHHGDGSSGGGTGTSGFSWPFSPRKASRNATKQVLELIDEDEVLALAAATTRGSSDGGGADNRG